MGLDVRQEKKSTDAEKDEKKTVEMKDEEKKQNVVYGKQQEQQVQILLNDLFCGISNVVGQSIIKILFVMFPSLTKSYVSIQIKKSVVCGIASLGYDHIEILGQSLLSGKKK